MRGAFAILLIKAGMALLPKGTRDTVRNLVMYHVPGALTEKEKQDIRELVTLTKRSAA